MFFFLGGGRKCSNTSIDDSCLTYWYDIFHLQMLRWLNEALSLHSLLRAFSGTMFCFCEGLKGDFLYTQKRPYYGSSSEMRT